jgi:hypothetical protein
MKVAANPHIYGFDPDAIIKSAPKDEELKLPDTNKPKMLKIGSIKLQPPVQPPVM